MKQDNLIQSVQRAIDILEILAGLDKEDIGVLELARILKLKAPTVHNLLKTLLWRGYVEQNSKTRGYRLGSQCLELTRGRMLKKELLEETRVPMRNLGMKIKESIVLAVLINMERYTVSQVDCEQPLKVSTNLFLKGDVYGTVTGKILLAYLSDDELRQFIASNGFPKDKWNNINSFKTLHIEMEKIRKKGYIEHCMKDTQVSAVAVPIYGVQNKVIATLGVFLPLVRYKGQHRRIIVRDTIATANEISQALR